MARRHAAPVFSWRSVAAYGLLLAAGVLALDWVQYQRLVRSRTADVYLFLVAAGFLALGLWAVARLLGRPEPVRSDHNEAAQASLGISDRELAVLRALADGRSNKEIAAALHISPHTVKTHVARLCEKLDARRRTEAIARARALGILS
jgi:DNA-binding CsgD family transcriptional regulator